MANPFVHVELSTTDVARAKAFYSGLFDWKLEDLPGMDYTFINVGEGTGGGIMKTVQPDSPSCWLSYVLVDDIEAATGKARSLGAKICKDVTEIPGMGWFSVFTDPTGATLALWQVNPEYGKSAA
jgi:predicted enzyme related to lactoylglutathione lyase